MHGMITNIQRCSTHDGPGIRTTVFLKGCNMRCAWCHNPETLSFQQEVLFHPEKCIGCGMCDQGCFSGARVICGREMTVEEVAAEVLRDRDYYGSDGGVTISGGEPTCQPAFTQALLAHLQGEGIHTAIESNLHCPLEVLAGITAYCDLVMADLKLFDPEAHRRWTGADNRRIIENLRRIGGPLILRTPVIAGVNDTDEEIGSIAAFAGTLPTLLYYELLPYHPLGLSKGAATRQERFSAPPHQEMERLGRLAAAHCAQVRIGGRIIA